jgi:hypothetical protein
VPGVALGLLDRRCWTVAEMGMHSRPRSLKGHTLPRKVLTFPALPVRLFRSGTTILSKSTIAYNFLLSSSAATGMR